MELLGVGAAAFEVSKSHRPFTAIAAFVKVA